MVNVPLPASTRGDVVRSIVEEQWLPRLRDFEPELIIISAGFDAHREDDLGQMGLVRTTMPGLPSSLRALQASTHRAVLSVAWRVVTTFLP